MAPRLSASTPTAERKAAYHTVIALLLPHFQKRPESGVGVAAGPDNTFGGQHIFGCVVERRLLFNCLEDVTLHK